METFHLWLIWRDKTFLPSISVAMFHLDANDIGKYIRSSRFFFFYFFIETCHIVVCCARVIIITSIWRSSRSISQITIINNQWYGKWYKRISIIIEIIVYYVICILYIYSSYISILIWFTRLLLLFAFWTRKLITNKKDYNKWVFILNKKYDIFDKIWHLNI